MTQGTRDVSIDELRMRVNTDASVLTLYFNKDPVMVSITGAILFELFIVNRHGDCLYLSRHGYCLSV